MDSVYNLISLAVFINSNVNLIMGMDMKVKIGGKVSPVSPNDEWLNELAKLSLRGAQVFVGPEEGFVIRTASPGDIDVVIDIVQAPEPGHAVFLPDDVIPDFFRVLRKWDVKTKVLRDKHGYIIVYSSNPEIKRIVTELVRGIDPDRYDVCDTPCIPLNVLIKSNGDEIKVETI